MTPHTHNNAIIRRGCAALVILLIAVSTLRAAPPHDVEIESLDGTVVRGTLTRWTPGQIEIEGATGMVRFASSELLAVRFNTANTAAHDPSRVSIELVDGSLVYGTELTVLNNRLTLVQKEGRRLSMSTRALASVLFVTQIDETRQQWHEMRKNDAAGDLIAILHNESLDYLEGVLGDVSAKTVRFRLDGDEIQVPRSKVYGLVYFHSEHAELAPKLATVTDIHGQRIEAQSVEMPGAGITSQELRVVSRAGVELTLPISSVTTIDYSAGKVVYLSDIEYESVEWTPFYGLSNTSDEFRMAHEPRRDAATAGGPLRLDGVEYAKGLAIRSRTEIVVRLPDTFRRFSAVVGIDDAVRPRGHVKLFIFADGEPLLAKDIDGDDPPLPLSLDISGVKHLKILVDYGRDQDVADHLDFCEARVSK